jgi:hypothetical protein
MKKLLIAAICVLAGVALFRFCFSNQTPPHPASPVVAQNSPASGIPASPAPSATASPPPAPAATAPADANLASSQASPPAQPQDLSARAGQFIQTTNAGADLPPDAVLRNVRRAVREYGQMFGGDPVGTNPEITAQLSGKNPKQINFLTGEEGIRVNSSGELVDAWGTPYFFHQLSGTDMEIHSAGPDRKMWTSDDIVTR